MERLKKLWQNEQEQPYEAIHTNSVDDNDRGEDDDMVSSPIAATFSWVDYLIFLLLGVAMLWAWNMLLAAGPYFQRRFESDPWISKNFQAAELSVSSITNLASMIILSRMQEKASYARRIVIALVMNLVAFTLLALSTIFFLGVTARVYFAFIIIIVFWTSLATAFCGNGVFAFVAGFGQGEYTQGIMTGQGVAGVLPCIAQIISVLSLRKGPSLPDDHSHGEAQPRNSPPMGPRVPQTAALAYFLTASFISILTLVAFFYLLRKQQLSKTTRRRGVGSTTQQPAIVADLTTSIDSLAPPPHPRTPIPLTHLFQKLRWLSLGVFLNFAITMFFPVFTQTVLSVRDPTSSSPIFHPSSFIPLAFLFWNAGDLSGRLILAFPSLSLTGRPRMVFCLAAARILFIPLYQLCNIRGRGAVVNSDVFYLLVVQALFGLSNGYVGSMCMMGAGEWVEPEEREAAGGFMSLCLVGGLAVGSLASFFAASRG